MALHAIELPSQDPTATKSGEVKDSSDSEIELISTTQTTLSVAEEVADRWNKRIKKDGRKVYFSPFDKREDRKEFETKAKCLAYMKKTQKASIELAKAQGNPHEPIEFIHAPKRQLSDLLPPNQAKALEIVSRARAETEGIRQQAIASKGGDIKATNVIGLPQGMAVQKLKELSDAELKVAANLCWTRGRNALLKIVRGMCKERNIQLEF